jgi:hypothetical protein
MSHGKYAHITAELLARKGEARPWPALTRAEEVQDYERLGILAVKADVTRQQLLKQALEEFLTARARQYGCACLGACNSNCGSAG